jgi:hypothetical protein
MVGRAEARHDFGQVIAPGPDQRKGPEELAVRRQVEICEETPMIPDIDVAVAVADLT